MTDKELLELAAKAAGMEPPLFWDDGLPIYPWNPLTNDGDALRLAVKLGINIGYVSDGASIIGAVSGDHEFEEINNGDPCAAARRAITRAAAEIGKAMP
jgi:hypothetical protein